MSTIDRLRARPATDSTDAEEVDESKLRPEQLGTWYLKQAMEFERSKATADRRSRKIAWRCVAGMAVITAVTIVTSGVVVLNNKPNPPGILMVNEGTGEIRQLKTLAETTITITRATDLFNLRRYIGFRESYDWETIQDTFDATVLLSSADEAAIYKAKNNEHNPLSPVNLYKDSVRVIATAGTVSFVNKTALVSFSKKYIPKSGEKPLTIYCQATIAFKNEDIPMDDRDRGINPGSYKTTSYHAVRDITKNPGTPEPGSYSGPTSCYGGEA